MFGEGEKWKRKRRKVFCEGNNMEKVKEENAWRKKIYFFAEGKKNGEGKGGKYFEKENVTIRGQTIKQPRKYRASQPIYHVRLR